MRVIDWLLGRDLEERSLEPMAFPTITTGGAIPFVSPTAVHGYARRIPSVARARSATINAVGLLPLEYEGGATVPPIVRRPDPDQSAEAFVRETVASLVDHGNAYWRIVPGGGREIAALKVTDPLDWVVTWDTSRTRRLYEYRGAPMREGRDHVHIAMSRGPAELVGVGPMQHQRLYGVLAALEYSQQYFISAAEPSGVLLSDVELDPTEAQLLRDDWIAQHQPGTRTPAVLSGGLKWEASGLSPKDSEWVATHGAGILDVAQVFGMPARILGYSQPGASLTYANISDVYLSWWRETLQTEYAAPIEEAFNGLLAGTGSVTFDPAPLLRSDVAGRYELLGALIRAGFEPAASLAALGLPNIPHTGLEPVTVSEQTEPEPAEQEVPTNA